MFAVLIGCGTAPINMLVDFLFQDIIAAPSAATQNKVAAAAAACEGSDEHDDLEEHERGGVTTLGNSFPFPMMASNNSNNSTSNSNSNRNRIVPILPVVRSSAAVPRTHRGTHGHSHSHSHRVAPSSPSPSSRIIMQRFTDPASGTRTLPPSVIRSRARASMVLKNAFENKELESESGPASTPARRSVMSVLRASEMDDEGENESSLYDTVERGGVRMSGDAVASFDSFCAVLYKQSEHLSGHAKAEFQARWGCDSHQHDSQHEAGDSQRNTHIFGSAKHEVPSGRSAKLRGVYKSMSCWETESKRTRKLILSQAMEETSQLSRDKLSKLEVASDMHVGLEIIHQFIIDLLG